MPVGSVCNEVKDGVEYHAMRPRRQTGIDKCELDRLKHDRHHRRMVEKWVMDGRGGDDTKESHRWGEGEKEEATKFT